MDIYYGHPSLDLLELSLLGRTSEREDEELEEHLLVCEACRVMHMSLAEEIDFIREGLAAEGEEVEELQAA